MNADYESVRWFTEYFYNATDIADNLLMISVTLAVWIAVFYSIVCILLSPVIMLCRGISDFRKGNLSIYEVIGSGLCSYPGLLPWSRARIDDPIVCYIMIYGYWIVVFGIWSFVRFGGIHAIYIEEGVYDPANFIGAIIIVVFANISWVYSIMLLVWNNRLTSRQFIDTESKKRKMFSIHPSVILSVWLMPHVLDWVEVILSLIGLNDPNDQIGGTVFWWAYFYEILDLFHILDLPLRYIDAVVINIVILWILVSCAWMVTKEILIQRMGSGAFARDSSLRSE